MLQRKQRNSPEKNSKLNTESFFLKRKNFQIISVVILVISVSYLSIKYLSNSKTETAVKNTIEHPLLITITNAKDSMSASDETKVLRKAQIEILNGCGIAGLTTNFKEFFLKQELDVISINNYKDFLQNESFFIVYDENYYLQIAKIAQKMKISEARIRKEFTSQPLNEVTFVIGSDYPKLVY